MDFQTISVFLTGFITIVTLLIREQYAIKRLQLSNKTNLKENNKVILDELQKVQKEQAEVDKLHTERINELADKLENIAVSYEINSFREKFVISYKNNFRSFIDKADTSAKMKNFLKSGIVELCGIFEYILINKFQIEKSEFNNEILLAENRLCNYFGTDNRRQEAFKKIIISEMNTFFFILKNDISVLENGNRLKTFETEAKKLGMRIINQIINYV